MTRRKRRQTGGSGGSGGDGGETAGGNRQKAGRHLPEKEKEGLALSYPRRQA